MGTREGRRRTRARDEEELVGEEVQASEHIDEEKGRGNERENKKNGEKHSIQAARKQMYTISVGFFGGLFAATITYIAHFLNFVPFGPGVIWQHIPNAMPIVRFQAVWGHVAGILFLSFLSILVAFLYYAIFRKIESPWLGVWFGLTIWAIIFLGINSVIPGTKTFQELGFTTNITFLCILGIYGLFIGYSISYQYQSDLIEEEREEREADS